MFNNIGSKIKSLAIVITVLGFITSFFFGIAVLIYSGILGIIIIIAGCIISWVSSFLLYGFGQLIENSDILVSNITNPPVTSTYIPHNNVPQSIATRIAALDKLKKEGRISEAGYNSMVSSILNQNDD